MSRWRSKTGTQIRKIDKVAVIIEGKAWIIIEAFNTYPGTWTANTARSNITLNVEPT
jgi:hypothetical protein